MSATLYFSIGIYSTIFVLLFWSLFLIVGHALDLKWPYESLDLYGRKTADWWAAWGCVSFISFLLVALWPILLFIGIFIGLWGILRSQKDNIKSFFTRNNKVKALEDKIASLEEILNEQKYSPLR